ncbi:WXG100 family type VII secretion target [Staphylococcus warneri]|uniref:WXG100 family type VII secretion target n=1 Tax=Staphylococcus warneri TaxID=1292 RepID=UPI0029294230|nr:WXG100 family type VII secretion target [Staphylococcus warneri]MDU9352062.1 WXG100 family type VII secretion target [Staphylococcus warneri]
MSSKQAEKKRKEEARLEELKQAMRSSTENMVDNAKDRVQSQKQNIQELLESIRNAGESLDGAFEGEASEAAQRNIDKLNSHNERMQSQFESLLNTFKVNG